MKKLTLTLCAVAAVVSASFAGTSTYSGKEMKQVEPAPCPTWYADNEWNIGISGIYAHNVGDDNDDNGDNGNFFFGDSNSFDDAWGGALDVKYFFARYWGVGVQGFGLSVDDSDNNFRFDNEDDDEWAWGLLGTFTFRYPIPCSRFAPYAWVGVGGYFHDNDNNGFFEMDGEGADFRNRNGNDDGKFMGQFGAGFEVRFSQHVALTTDVSYNDVEGGDFDHIQFRGGLNFAF